MKNASGQGRLSRADRDREVVQRTAELLTSSLSLEELFHAVCSLLSRFIDASTVFIALKDQQGARIAYMLNNGVVGALDNGRVGPGTITDSVVQSGKPVLKCRPEDWPQERHFVSLPGQPENEKSVSAIFAPLKFGSKTIGALSVQSRKENAYDEEDVELLQTCALYLSVRVHQAQLETQSAKLENIASTDTLTGVPNRRSFNQRYSAEWRRSVRRGSNVALVLVDIDFFKAFNDTYGHVAGDAALQQVATTLASCLARSGDFFARYGGEEFVAILPETNVSGALAIAERMRQTVFDLCLTHSGSLLQRLSVSIGVACKIPVRGTSPDTLLEAADATLYQAKRGGRNRVVSENYRSDAPPAYPSKSHRHNLPESRPGQSFGRIEHLSQIRKLMRSSRLVTLAGPPGIGKSYLAVEAARREVGRFPDGVFYVDCSTVTDERYFGNKVGSVFGVPETPVVAPGFAASEFLKSKRALVVLDNCDAVSNLCSQYVRALLAQTTETRILATSREPTLTAGEVAYSVPPLSDADAVALFLERASAVSLCDPAPADRAAVERMCARLAGLPRALQLAAAQLRTMSLQQLETRLAAYDAENRDEFTQWSYEVLTPVEQRLLRGLSVFSGGAEEDAIAAVCGNADGVLSLADKGLVNIEADGPAKRYIVPASIRTAAWERANELGERQTLALRHARYYAKRARELDERHPTKQWKGALAAMAPELDNLRAALLFTVTQEYDLQLGADLSCHLIHYWQQMGRASAGRDWIEELLAHGDAAFGEAVRAKLLYGLARLDSARSRCGLESALLAVDAYRKLGDENGLAAALFEVAAAHSGLGDIDAADAYLREALEISMRTGNKRCMADVLNGTAVAEQWRGHPQRARELLERSLALFRELEEDRGVASLLGNLGDLAATVGEYDRAVTLSRQSLAILERLHDPQSTAWQLLNLGAFELKRRNADAARPALRRSLELVLEYRDEWLSANCVDALSRLALTEKDWTRALRLAAFADTVFENIGVPRQPPDRLDYEFVVREAKVTVGLQAASAAMESGRALSWQQAIREAMLI